MAAAAPHGTTCVQDIHSVFTIQIFIFLEIILKSNMVVYLIFTPKHSGTDRKMQFITWPAAPLVASGSYVLIWRGLECYLSLV